MLDMADETSPGVSLLTGQRLNEVTRMSPGELSDDGAMS